MTTKQLSAKKPIEYAVASGATTPDPGGTAARGAWVWSTTLSKPAYWDGAAWQTFPAGGGGSPGGPTNAVQYNNGAGGLGGEAAFVYDPATNTLTVEKVGLFTAQSNIYMLRGNAFQILNGSLARWGIYADTATESGGDAGTDLRILSYTDAGTPMAFTPFTIERATGRITQSVKAGTAGAINTTVGNAAGAVSMSVVNQSAASGAQARYDLTTGTPNAFALLAVIDGAAPLSDFSHGSALTGGMWFTTASVSAPIVMRLSGTERFRLQNNVIQSDFSGALGTRSILQSNAVNQFSDVGVAPNGSGTVSAYSAYSLSDTANASIGSLKVVNADSVSLISSKSGSASTLPIKVQVDATTLMAFDSASTYLPSLTEPATPAASNTRIFSFDIAGRSMPAWKSSEGVLTPMQPHVGVRYVAFNKPSATTAINSSGLTLTNVGTVSTFTLTSASKLTSTRRFNITSTTTAGALASHYGTLTEVWRGNAAGLGGFFYVARFNLSTLAAGMRAFIGLVDFITAPTNIDPTTTTTPARIGLGINANTGNWNFVHNASGSAPTVIPLGANFPVDTTTLLKLILRCDGNGGNVGYRVENVSTGAVTSGTISTNLPSTSTFLARSYWATNNATAAAVAIGSCGQYIEAYD